MTQKTSWLAIRTPLAPRRATLAKCGAFLLPLAVWCIISYVPFVAHPMVRITDPGGSIIYSTDTPPVPRANFNAENARLAARGEAPMKGSPANPYWLPAPHEVALAFWSAVTEHKHPEGTPTVRRSLALSCWVIFLGFVFSAVVGVPLGILCGTFDLFSKLSEPFVDFIRYMPAPAFAALCIAMLDLPDDHIWPKVGIIWIGTFFQMVLVVANTTRQIDPALLEAAQTLGASRRSLLLKVILPGILPNLYNDMRILIGWAWTYLIVAELIGIKSGISEFIEENSRHFYFANVYAGIMMIGLIGLTFDQFLAFVGEFLFPWQPRTGKAGILGKLVRAVIALRSRRNSAVVPAPVLAGAASTAPPGVKLK